MERRIKREDEEITISLKSFGVLTRIESAIQDLKDDSLKEVGLSFTLADLYRIRRALTMDLVGTELARDNILDGITYRKSLKESENNG